MKSWKEKLKLHRLQHDQKNTAAAVLLRRHKVCHHHRPGLAGQGDKSLCQRLPQATYLHSFWELLRNHQGQARATSEISKFSYIRS